MTDQQAVRLRDITFATVREIIELQVSEQQRDYVAPNATSIAEGLLNPGAWLRAIYANETPVGFAMLLDPKIPGALSRRPIDPTSVMLWRLMVATPYQKRGYAKAALDLLCVQAKQSGASSLLSSYVPGDHGPEQFYLRYGFKPTGSVRGRNDDEIEIRIEL